MIITKGCVGKMQESEDKIKVCEMLSPRLKTTIVLINSHPWIPALGEHSTIPMFSDSWKKKEIMGPYPEMLNYRLLLDSGRGVILYLVTYTSPNPPGFIE